MATTVVPTEAMAWNTRTKTLIQEAFHILRRVILSRGRSTIEEVCRWHLPRITRNHYLLAPRNRTDGIPRSYLRSLIENNQVKKCQICRKILCNRKRTHEHTRGKLGHSIPHLDGQLSHGFVTSGLLQFMLQNAKAALL